MPNKNLNSSGLAHIVLVLAVVTVTALVGVYMLVSSSAKSSIHVDPRANPHTNQCPGNKVKYGVPNKNTATASARQRIFGNPYPNANTETINFMGKDVRINKKIAPCLKAVEWDLVNKYKTTYTVKHIWGASQIDGNNPDHYFHPYGAAVDINPPDNPFYPDCPKSCPHDMPAKWVKAFRDHGFFWGGHYKNSKDYMHFEWHGQI